MNVKEKLKNSECEVCADALFEIIRLEADLISTNKRYDRMIEMRPSSFLRKRAARRASKSAAGRALNQASSA